MISGGQALARELRVGRRLVPADSGYRVIPVAAPNDEERAHHYLWRFWNRIPRNGCVTIFDRTWYGRVLVERVEGFASEAEWRRAYSEINEFEEQLVENGAILLKFWLQVSDEEQLNRFRASIKKQPERVTITRRAGYSGGGATGGSVAVVFVAMGIAGWRLDRVPPHPRRHERR